ncbi:MAG: hypothetical protein HXY38_05555, partial [Chloroflexi bacterium]|nr:hypothetical protein [Chloroflexota bacterium]
MFQRKRLPYFIGIILIVTALFGFLGLSNLWQAESAQRREDHQTAAAAYIRAAHILFWRDDLYEKAGVSYSKSGDFSKAIEYFKLHKISTAEGWLSFCACYI